MEIDWKRRIDNAAESAAEYAGNTVEAKAATQFMAGAMENLIRDLIKEGIIIWKFSP